MPGRTRIACLIVVLALAGAGASGAHAATLKRLDYETGNFGQWTALQAVGTDARIVRDPVNQGRFAARFVVRPGDDPINSSGERSEAYFLSRESEGTESWWAWSTYFPTAFHPNAGSWNIFTQWASGMYGCTPSVSFAVNKYVSPPRLKLQVWGGRMSGSCQPSSKRTWNFGVLRRNRWLKFRFHVKWSSSSSTGFVQVWLNGRLRIPKTHVATLYRGDRVYVKQGFYRGDSRLTTTIYHDGLHRYTP